MGADLPELEQRAVNVVRGLSMDGPQRAGNGHPGTAMALAPVAHVLFHRVMKHDPTLPEWHDRDRFVLSCGHASILLYSFLHLTGYGQTIDDLKEFRQLGSRTPGHPERLHAPGIDTTTGPLGQGIASAVGMAMAEEHLRATFGPEVCDHHTFVLCSDGDLQEGISHEAASLAGHQALGRLVVIWDDNHISIDGPTELSWSDNTPDRFRAYGWDVDEIGEVANDLDALEAAIRRGMGVTDKPTFIALRTHIGYPSSLQDSEKAHGEPLGADVVRETKAKLGLPPEEDFWVPEDVLALYREAIPRGQAKRHEWEQRLANMQGDREAYDAAQGGRPLTEWVKSLPAWQPGDKVATRKAGAAVLEAVKDLVPGLMVGGADLTGNTGVKIKVPLFTRDDRSGRLVHYGIREHGMAAAMNGMAAHGGILPVGGTFFIFSDYCRPSIRIAALSDLKVVYSFSHDSIGLGPDGPTHQPVEHLASLRAMPALRVIRPADANETAHAYRVAFDSDGPTALILSRQDLPVLEGTEAAYDGVARGAYVLREDDEADLTLIGTGSEVHLCLDAVALLAARGIRARVVSMPSWELFEEATDDEKEEVLRSSELPALAVEAAASFGWERWAEGVVALDRFGASGPGDEVMASFGFTAEGVAEEAEELLKSLQEEFGGADEADEADEAAE